jgi:uncharacterized protein
MATLDEARQVAAIVRDAGGRIVGRTRLQKIGFVLEAVGLGDGFPFKYKHYGPYSDELTAASRTAAVVGLIDETEHAASWGGSYSTFATNLPPDPEAAQARLRLAQEMVRADAVELELAATALFLARSGTADAWAETSRRKPEKAAAGRLEGAKELYGRLRLIEAPTPLPQI